MCELDEQFAFNFSELVMYNMQFFIPYKITRKNLIHWMLILHRKCNYFFWLSQFQILPGNSNTYAGANNTLNPAIFASKIRLIPYSDHPRTVCLRIELVGCIFQGKIHVRQGIKCIYKCIDTEKVSKINSQLVLSTHHGHVIKHFLQDETPF